MSSENPLNFAKAKLAQLEKRFLEKSAPGAPDASPWSVVVAAVNEVLAEIKSALSTHSFKDERDEVEFFKVIKPRLIALQLFAVEWFTIDSQRPIGDFDEIKSYYVQQQQFFKQFLDKHQFLYQYYLLHLTELDAQLFTRSAKPTLLFIPESQESDPTFTASAEFLFARFIAYERICSFLTAQIVGRIQAVETAAPKPVRPSFRWTGQKSNLVELAYGLYCTSQLNSGTASLSEIVDWLQYSFDIDLSRYYRRFSEIKMRKSISKTHFLDEMQAALNAYISKDDVN